MFITKTKKTKAIDMDSKLKEYAIKNYDSPSLTEKIQNYFGDLTQNRNVISQMGEVEGSIDQIKQNINIITTYINQIIAIKQKMTFGKEDYSCKIEFTWNDTLKGSSWKSYNIWFEIYNAIFNLAVSYFCLGEGVGKAAMDKNGHKEALKYYKNAMYLFNLIKEEAMTKIIEKELPYDLFPSHMDYCKTLCEINGQIEIYKIAKENDPTKFSLHAKLLCEVSKLYEKLRSLCDNPQTKKGTSDNIISFFEYRIHYYKALACRDLRDGSKKEFDERGLGYGEIVFYQKAFVLYLTECQKLVKDCGKLVDVDKFEKELEKEKFSQQEMEDLNHRIYHQAEPDPDKVSLENKNMMGMTLPEDLYIKENAEKLKSDERIFCSDLELLVVKEVRSMINAYKSKMNDYISQNLDKLENEGTINNFVQSLCLPKKLAQRPEDAKENDPPNEFPPQLWNKIERVQQMGGTMALSRIMNGIMNKSQYLIDQCQNLLRSLEAEDRDDQAMRNKYRNKWIREPSQKLNFKLVQGAQQYIKNLNNTKQFDQKEKNEIVDNARYFEQLSLPRDQLVNNIPRRETLAQRELPEEREVRSEILKLYELSDKCMNIIKPIFAELNDDSAIVGYFIEVLAKKTTEQAIYERFKETYETKLNDLKKLSEEVKSQKDVVNNVVQRDSEAIRAKQQPNIHNEAKDYFRMLDQYANMYLNKYEKLMKGDKYYNDQYQKITNLVKLGNEWMIKRSNEKNVLLSTFGGPNRQGRDQGRYLTQSTMEDPFRNPYTTQFGSHLTNNHYGNQGNKGGQ
jgi:programmed cell death 6-interacting protein